MKILIAGGTGLLGSAVAREFRDHEVLIATRTPRAPHHVSYDHLPSQVDAVVNFAGDPIPGLWTKAKKRKILESRVEVTHHLVDWILDMPSYMPVFVSASAVGIYGDRPGEVLTESSSPDPHHRFRSKVCLAWEGEANRAKELGVRTAILRVGNVLSTEGGMLPTLLTMARYSPALVPWAANAVIPWISIEDTARMVRWLVETDSASGPYNCTAPEALTQREFFSVLAKKLHRLALPSPPKFLTRLVFGDLSEALIESQNVRPERAENQGFKFEFPAIDAWLNHAFSART